MSRHPDIPVIDIFAGPGGLGEGFSRYCAGNRRAFRSVLSVEKDPAAHRTLTLRAFYRQFGSGEAPAAYFERVRSRLTTEELFAQHERQAAAAQSEAWLAELGSPETTVDAVRSRVATALGHAGDWVLLGGPPCQAYSLVGRSRNRGIKGYRFESDHKTTLYLEYLQLIADFWPAVFVLENVKGLLSAKQHGESMFARIVEDLQDPASAIAREGRTCRRRGHHSYDIYPIVAADDRLPGSASADPADFVVRSELFGVPQARHRVIAIGVRRGFSKQQPSPLALHDRLVTVREAIGDLPKLRSALSSGETPERWAAALGRLGQKTWQARIAANGGADVARRVAAVAELARGLSRLPRTVTGLARRPCIAYERGWYEADLMPCIANHEARTHMEDDLLRYLFAACFTAAKARSPELRDFPRSLLPAHQNAELALGGSHFADRFRVQCLDRPSTTITSHISRDGHYYIHPDPEQCRSLTVREAARLQTFPDTYFFEGNRTAQYVQVGNAVPPLLAHQIAERVHRLFR
jgi:DNA (cytosine-5)-methyltransferase 1